MDKYKKLLSNTAILGIGTFGSKLLTFLLLPLYTGCLTSAEYGVADIIVQTANLLIPLLSLGITDAVFRYVLDRTIDRRQALTTGFLVIIAGTAVSFILFPFLNLITYFKGYMWLILLYVFAANLHSLVAQYIRARDMTQLFALQGIVGTFIMIVFNILFLGIMKIGIVGYVLSTVLSDLIVTAGLVYLVRVDKAIKPRYFNKALASEMLRFSMPLILTTIFWWIINFSDRFMITAFIGDEVNGLYAAAFKIPTVLILLAQIFIEAWQFSAVTEKDKSSRRSHTIFFGRVFDSYQGLLFISASGLIAFSKVFTVILFNDSYYSAWSYMPLLTLATIFSNLVTFLGSVYLVDKKSLLSFSTALAGAVTNIILNLILIPTPLGANGAALATFVSYMLVFLLRAVNTQKFIPFNLHTGKLLANSIILSVQTVFMVFEISGWIVIQLLGIVLIFAINLKPILAGFFRIFSHFPGKGKA